MRTNKIRSNHSLWRRVDEPANIETDEAVSTTEEKARNILASDAKRWDEVDEVHPNADDEADPNPDDTSVILHKYWLNDDGDR